jgi:hypothetical protein
MHGFSKKNSPSLGLAGRIAAPAATARTNEGGTALLKHATAAGGAEGGAAAPRLEYRTHLDEARYRVSLRNYGYGLAEIGWSFIPASVPRVKAGKGKSQAREENETRAVRRARSRLRHLILASRADHLLTLTYRENVTDFKRAASDLSRFVRVVKSRLPGWVYIAVAEEQKRGAWHWHLAVVGRQDVDQLRSVWRQVVGEGNIDVRPPKGRSNHRLLALVKYLGKYLAKAFANGSRDINGRRFRSSLGIDVPLAYLTVPDEARGNAAGYALSQLMMAAGSVGFVWIADDKPAGWACSWK